MKYIFLFVLAFIFSAKLNAQKINVKIDPYLKTEVKWTDNEKLYEKLIQRVYVNLTKIDNDYIIKFEKYNGDLLKFDVYSIAKNDLGIILLKSGDTAVIKSTSYQNSDIQYNASEYRHQYYIAESSLNKNSIVSTLLLRITSSLFLIFRRKGRCEKRELKILITSHFLQWRGLMKIING